MSRQATEIALSTEERETLEQWVRGPRTEQRLATRARIILAAGAGGASRASGGQQGPVAAALGDVPKHQVWRVLRRHGIQLQRRRSWCISTDPEFAAKAADIVGLYLNPPENAVVLCVDEQPHHQGHGVE